MKSHAIQREVNKYHKIIKWDRPALTHYIDISNTINVLIHDAIIFRCVMKATIACYNLISEMNCRSFQVSSF